MPSAELVPLDVNQLPVRDPCGEKGTGWLISTWTAVVPFRSSSPKPMRGAPKPSRKVANGIWAVKRGPFSLNEHGI